MVGCTVPGPVQEVPLLSVRYTPREMLPAYQVFPSEVNATRLTPAATVLIGGTTTLVQVLPRSVLIQIAPEGVV